MKTLYVHIGSPKTASTALQFFCVDNSEVLNQKGYCYPLFPQTYPDASRIRAYFLIVKLKNKFGKRSKKWEEDVFQEGMAVIHKSFENYDNVIISDERIWRSMDIERKDLWEKLMKEAKKGGFQIRVIAYVRRQDKFLISLWNQQIKIIKVDLAKCTIEEWMNRVNLRARLEYADKLDRIADIVGKENVIVRRFDGTDNFEGGSIYSDFLSAVGLALTEEYEIKQEVVNIGLYGNTQEIKRVINFLPQMIKDRNAQNFIMEMLQECSEISKKNYPCEMLSAKEVAALLKEYEAGNRKIAEEYLHETNRGLFDNTIRDIPKWQKDNPFILEDLVRFANVSMRALLVKYGELRQELSGLEKEFKTLLSADGTEDSDWTGGSAAEAKVLPKWDKEDPNGIDPIILFVGGAVLRLYQEIRDLKKEVSAIGEAVKQDKVQKAVTANHAQGMRIHYFCKNGGTNELEERIAAIPDPLESQELLAERLVEAVDQAAVLFDRKNQRFRQETADMKRLADLRDTPKKSLFEKIFSK